MNGEELLEELSETVELLQARDIEQKQTVERKDEPPTETRRTMYRTIVGNTEIGIEKRVTRTAISKFEFRFNPDIITLYEVLFYRHIPYSPFASTIRPKNPKPIARFEHENAQELFERLKTRYEQ